MDGENKNDTNAVGDYVHYLQTHQAETIALLVGLCFLIVFGSCGNLLIIAAVGITKSLRIKTHNYFVINLAICDLIIASVLNSCFVVAIVMGEKWFSMKPKLCGSIAFVCLSCCLASLALVGLIAVNRYFGICRNDIVHKVFNKRNTVIINILVWVYSLWLNIAVLNGWGEYTYDRKMLGCVWNRNKSRTFTLSFLAGVFVPIATVAICYSLIFHTIYKTKKMLNVHNKSASNRSMEKEIKIAKVLFVIFVMFLLMNSPFVLVVLIDPMDRLPVVVYVVAVQLMHGNASGINCVIYGLTHKAFAQGYRKVYHMLFRKCGYSEHSMDSFQGSVATSGTEADRNSKEPSKAVVIVKNIENKSDNVIYSICKDVTNEQDVQVELQPMSCTKL